MKPSLIILCGLVLLCAASWSVVSRPTTVDGSDISITKAGTMKFDIAKLSPKDGDIIVFKVGNKNDVDQIIAAVQSSPIGVNCPILILDRDTEIVLMSADALKNK